jgi:hypothetical protein
MASWLALPLPVSSCLRLREGEREWGGGVEAPFFVENVGAADEGGPVGEGELEGGRGLKGIAAVIVSVLRRGPSPV